MPPCPSSRRMRYSPSLLTTLPWILTPSAGSLAASSSPLPCSAVTARSGRSFSPGALQTGPVSLPVNDGEKSFVGSVAKSGEEPFFVLSLSLMGNSSTRGLEAARDRLPPCRKEAEGKWPFPVIQLRGRQGRECGERLAPGRRNCSAAQGQAPQRARGATWWPEATMLRSCPV